MRKDFGTLRKNHAIQIYDLKARGRDTAERRSQHLRGITAFVGRIGVGKEFPDIAAGRRAEQGVSNRVQEHIGIAVAQRPAVVRDCNAAQHETRAGAEPVGVVAEADANRRG